jgi:putative membrane protein
MPSDAVDRPQRLHPVSLLFAVGSFARSLLLPAIAVMFVSRASYQIWFLIPFGIAGIASLVKYAFYRYRLGDEEMMVREGVLTRNERHIPYARIQNINLIQNPFHRWLKVAEVHVETASGTKPEAIISVLSLASVADIRERVFKDRAKTGGIDAESAEAEEESSQRLLELPTRELILLGLISNRGMVVIAAVLGAITQFDFWDLDWERIVKEAPHLTKQIGLPAEQPGLATSIVLGVAVVLVGIALMKLLSVIWALFRFHGFTLDLGKRNLRARYGLFTRYTASIPSHRIQLLSSRTTPLHRLWKRSGVLAETAGGGSGNEAEDQRASHRLWLAPIIGSAETGEFSRAILPDVDLRDAQWNRLPLLARRRIRNRGLFVSSLVAIVSVVFLGWWALAVAAVTFAWSFLHAAMWWKHAAWTIGTTAMAFRSGWWTRRASIVRFAKIQTVSLGQTPFDRRHDMARIAIDTAGAGKAGHRVSVPFLPREVAVELHDRLAVEAARRSFRW